MKKNQAGFGVIESLLALGILGVVLAATVGLISFAGKKLTQQRLIQTRSRISALLIRISGTPAAIRAASIADKGAEVNNASLRACVTGGDWSIPCKDRNSDGSFLPFRLYLPTVENVKDEAGKFSLQTSGAITGTPTKPIRYNPDGTACDTAQTECPPSQYPIETFTEFLPLCPPHFEAYWRGWTNIPIPKPMYPDGLKPLSQCPFARYMKIKLTIRPSDPALPDAIVKQATTIKIVTLDVALARHARQ